MKDLPLAEKKEIFLVQDRKTSLSLPQNGVLALVSHHARKSRLSLQLPFHVPSVQGRRSTAVKGLQSSLNSRAIFRPAAPFKTEEFSSTSPSLAYVGSSSTQATIRAEAPRSCEEVADKAVLDLPTNPWTKN